MSQEIKTQLKRCTSADEDFIALVRLLDADLAIRNGEKENSFYAQFNKIDMIKNALVYYVNGIAVGCGAFKEFKEFNTPAVEIKRMYVKPEFRGRKIGAIILKELEQWASVLNITECVLETGTQNPEALRLYQKEGYTVIPNYGQYKNVARSVCMKKSI